MDPKRLFVVRSTQGLKAFFWPLLSLVMESPSEGVPAEPSGSETDESVSVSILGRAGGKKEIGQGKLKEPPLGTVMFLCESDCRWRSPGLARCLAM